MMNRIEGVLCGGNGGSEEGNDARNGGMQHFQVAAGGRPVVTMKHVRRWKCA